VKQLNHPKDVVVWSQSGPGKYLILAGVLRGSKPTLGSSKSSRADESITWKIR